MPTTSSQQKETKMSNVETLQTTRQSTQTALVVFDQMSPKEALMTHKAEALLQLLLRMRHHTTATQSTTTP